MSVHLKPRAIGDLCRRLGVSRERLAAQIGLSPASLFRLDRGDAKPGPKAIAALLSAAPGLKFEDLFTTSADSAEDNNQGE